MPVSDFSLRKAVAIAIVAALATGIGYFAYADYKEKEQIDSLQFSNTQEWDPLVYAQKTISDPLVGESAFLITLPPPPQNSSKETGAELAYLHELEDNRTTEELINIERELSLESALFGDQSYSDIVRERPHTKALLTRAGLEISGIVIAQKEYFDRVRAHKLDETLKPAIPVPGHPAYPSGHATQSMLIALILGELNPEAAARYRASALSIAHDREIAGVHYPSDSRAGQMLAEEYFALLKENKEFQSLLAEAKAEW